MNFKTVPSPNFGERREDIDMLVLHYTGMADGASALRRMCDPQAEVSAHYMIEEDGCIFQLVDEEKRAWHAGRAKWSGSFDINSRSIGIEIVNGGHDYGLPHFTDSQIDAVIKLSADIVGRHAISAQNIVGHSDVAPGRKKDPGEKFPWERLSRSGLGIWPAMKSDDDREGKSYVSILRDIGYIPPVQEDDYTLSDVVFAFQQRWLPHKVTGEVCVETLGRIAQVGDAYKAMV